ncbi:transposase [Janthinobacterium aquaticum]|uniref:transposase n=1 Tax=Janthinobacterium sp. FT58W TaxID=2654254 RepID=UPI0012641E6C|nr:transposase [Janthinobacterium sp. FT58W]KAB8044573.1 addiction module toxin RelE [Janthinobacterium sp. FT58W]
MTRPLRIEFPGALYHVTSRGDRRCPIYLDDTDRLAWQTVLAMVCERHHFVIHSFCQMDNHYHLLLETVEGNLSQGMRQLNGIYTQRFNQRHQLVGHLLQGRFKAILVQKGSYLLELHRYITLNPVRAQLVALPDDWRWGSHHFLLANAKPPDWLACNEVMGQFGRNRLAAIEHYRAFIGAGMGLSSPLTNTVHQILLGDEAFVATHQQSQQSASCKYASRAQRRAVALVLEDYQLRYPDRDEAMARAYLSTAYNTSQIAAAFGVSGRTVSRAIQSFEARQKAGGKVDKG